MLLEGGLDWKPMGFSPSDMEFQKTKEAAAREIAVAFGVPPMLLGIPGEATYANYQEAHRAFYRLTVLPLATKVAAALGRWLSAHAGRDAGTLAPDLDQMPALAAERDAQWARVANADFLTAAPRSGRCWACHRWRSRAVTETRARMSEPFACAPGLRLEAHERVTKAAIRGAGSEARQARGAMERLERRLWLAVYGVAAAILAQAVAGLC